MSIPTPVVEAGNEHDDGPMSITNRDELRQAVHLEKMRREDERKDRIQQQEMKETIDSGKKLLREIGAISQGIGRYYVRLFISDSTGLGWIFLISFEFFDIFSEFSHFSFIFNMIPHNLKNLCSIFEKVCEESLQRF